MDGDLSGAIMTGSGSLPAAYSALQGSSSPVNFTIPTGFTPPVNPGSGGVAPYTVNSGGLLTDNSASRLNVAKAAIQAILTTYISSADFALMDYSTSGLTAYTTWVYQMSQPGGFTFTSMLGTSTPGTTEYVANPCYGVNASLGNQVSVDCRALKGFYGNSVSTQPYMVISASSDDSTVNDVLYAGGGQADPICVVYGGPSPPNPFPPSPPGYSLADYENNPSTNSVLETYSSQVNNCARQTGPTNAGYVPYSTQVIYEERGFGFYTTGEVASVTAASSTPLVPMQSAGGSPTTASVENALSYFMSPTNTFLAPETNSADTHEIKASATQAPMAGLIASAQTYYVSQNPHTTNGCATQRYVILLTDGLPTLDLSGHAWPPLGSSAAAPAYPALPLPNGYGVSATFNPDGSLATTNDQALQDVITNLTTLAGNGVKTYIIGLGAGVNPATTTSTAPAPAVSTLTAMAVAGGTGSYFKATSPQDVIADLQSILTTILAQSQAIGSSAVNSTSFNNNSVVYQSQFVTSDTDQDWTGNLWAFPINALTGVVDTSIADAKWSAQAKLDAQIALGNNTGYTTRIIATWDPVTSAGIPFEWTPGTTSTSGIASTTLLGQDLEAFTSDPSGQDVVNYLRGSPAQEGSSGQFRSRTHTLADIVGSSPAYIGPSNESIQSASYVAFEASTATRPAMIYVGADDGMLHAFDAITGDERFAYIPRGVYANLINLVSPYYNSRHQFFVNGSPQAGDVQFTDSSWHTVLVGTEGAGGSSVFALDVTNPLAITSEAALASAVLWDFTDTDMGLGFSTPAITNTNSGWQVFVGNGYNSPNQKPYLYALNPQTGAITEKIDLCAAVAAAICKTTESNGLSSVTAVNSGGQVAGTANLVYAGDLQGNLWRVDVSNANPSLWAVSVLFQASSAGDIQPITTKPVASLNPGYPQTLGTMVFFGTGQLLGEPDLTNEQTQALYGVYDPPAGSTTPVTSASLIQQTLSNATVGATGVLTVTGNAVSIPTNEGWFIDLNLLTGNRLINNPLLQSGGELTLTTYQPAANDCQAGGNSQLLVLNYATGGAFTTPQFTLNGSNTINSSDTVTQTTTTGGVTTTVTMNPVGISLTGVYASAPTIRSGSWATASAIILVTESSPGSTTGGLGIGSFCSSTNALGCATIGSNLLKGASKNRTAWWEIRQ